MYSSLVSRKDASRLRRPLLAQPVFGDSAKALVRNPVEDETHDEAELKRVRDLLKEKPE